jgi:hypothetical protein
MANFTIPSRADQTAEAPMLVVFETSVISANFANSAQLRNVGAQRVRQSREDPALEIQMFQVIDPATGNPIQVVRVLLVVPSATSEQSI